LFGLTRHAYYKAVKRKEQQDIRDHLMIEKVKKIREDLPGTGTRRLHHMTISYRKKHGIKMGRDKLHEVLRKADMHVTFKKRRTRTTYSDHGYKRYKNLTEGLEITGINQLFVSDITYIPVGNGFAYLSLVTDAYSRKIIGWHLHKSLHAIGSIKALNMALNQKGEVLPYQLIHHSDRGIQYCCNDYIKLLNDNKILVSMTNFPDPLENALAERMHRTLKEEFKLERGFPTFNLALQAVARINLRLQP
jgi:transposase InsO family protein